MIVTNGRRELRCPSNQVLDGRFHSTVVQVEKDLLVVGRSETFVEETVDDGRRLGYGVSNPKTRSHRKVETIVEDIVNPIRSNTTPLFGDLDTTFFCQTKEGI